MKQYQGIITEFGSLHEAIKQFKIKNLKGADLQGADLRNADLQGAYLQGADLNIIGKSILSIAGIGSEKRVTMYNVTNDQIRCGCFIGSLYDFIKQIKKKYDKSTLYYQEYKKAVWFLFWTARLRNGE